jgi:hypothetical protein
VAHAGRKSRLVEQHPRAIRIARQMRVGPLDRYRAAETFGPEKAPEVNRAHPAFGDPVEDEITANGYRRCRSVARGHSIEA